MIQYNFILAIVISIKSSYQQNLYYSSFTETIIHDLDDWNFLNINPSNVISTCGTTSILGGFEKFAYSQAAIKFLQLPPHYRIQISFTLFLIDSWDYLEYYQVYVDQDLAYNLGYTALIAQSNLCGRPQFKDSMRDVQFEVLHNGLTANIYLTSTLNSDGSDESWGFRNFRLFVYECPSGCLVCSQTDSQADCLIWVHLHSFYTDIDPNLFNIEGWTIDNQQLSKQSQCKSIPIVCGQSLCGKNTILSKNLYSLPSHAKMKIKFKYLKVDGWDVNDQAILKVDGEIKWIKKLSLENQYLYSICGNSYQEVYFNVEITFPHSSTNSIIQILNNLDEDSSNESFGIRDIQIFIEQIICGDKIVQFQEDCDDGNSFPFDGCFNCKYSCVQGCSLCHKGQCLSCLSGWIFQSYGYMCLKIIDYQQTSSQIIESELTHQNVIQCQKGFNLNQISNQCESICGDNFITNYEECDIVSEFCHECKLQCGSNCMQCYFGVCQVCKKNYLLQNNHCIKDENTNICQPQCNVCIESTCYLCQSGQILVLGQCQEICGNNDLAIYTLEECVCDLNCLECIKGVCYKCSDDYLLRDNFCFEYFAICGDQIIQENEECDDGNDSEFDGCFNCRYSCPKGCQDCQFGVCQDQCQYGFYFINNLCSTICGDSIIAGLEQCEDGNSNQFDGCYQCRYSCPQYCLDCLNEICITCELGYLLINNTYCMSICGDGILKSKEQCDDGNQEDGDGCSKSCEVETNWICNQGSECQFVKYPVLKIEYLMQKNQYQYVQISFSQPVQSQSNICYKDTIELEVLELNEALVNISIVEVQPAQFLITSDVQYILQIEIFTNLDIQPILQVKLTEQLYSSDSAPLTNMMEYILLNYPNYLTQQQVQFANAFQMVSRASVFAIYGSSIILILIGNSLSIWGILEALQQQSYLKFINVLYPQTLIIYFQFSELISVQALLDSITKINKMAKVLKFPYLESYEKFKFYEINADITEGLRTEILLFGSFIAIYLITLITIQIINNLEINDKFLQFPKFIRFLQKLKRKIYSQVIRVNFNFIICALLACSWDLIFMALLELNTYHDLTYYRSFVRLSITFVILITTLIFILFQMNGLLSWKKQNFNQFWAKKKEFFILLKKVLVLTILVYFQYEQVLQTLILTMINVSYLIYIINFKLFDDQYEQLKSLIMETSLTLFTASTFVNWDLLSNYIQYSQRVIISWIQIALLVSVLVLFMLLGLYNSILVIKNKIIILIANRNIQRKQDEDKSKQLDNKKNERKNFQLKRFRKTNNTVFNIIQQTA